MAFRKKGDGYYYHDDRSSGGHYSGRHVSFKSRFGGKNKINRQRRDGDKLRKFIDDGDIEMTVKMNRGPNPRFNPMSNSRKKMNIPKNRRPLPASPSNWYKVIICYGKKFGRPDIMKSLHTFLHPTEFKPIDVKMEEEDMTFYVDNEATANAIYGANLKIQMRDGWKVQIKVRPNMPCVELNDSLKEKIKLVMSTKYDTVSQKLDLSRFHVNEEFLNNDLFVPLNRQNMLLGVFQIISESVPNLRSLNLSNNNIFTTEHFSLLKRYAPELKSLDLSRNKIRNLTTITGMQGMKLEILNLDNNPLCDEYQDQTTYVREVRKIFRMLRHLDGVDLPPPVDFDIEESQNKLPQSHDSFLCNAAEGQAFTRQFLEQYFSMYDNHVNRDALGEAYAENSQFSMTAFSPTSGFNLNRYITESRNLKKVNHFERRAKLLHIGKQEIIRFLNTLPKTQHDLTSFSVDLTVFTPELITLCVCGIFRETEVVIENKSAFIKAFSRTFVLIPVGSGFTIVNDMLAITNASSVQIAKAFPAPSATPLPSSPQQPVQQQQPPPQQQQPLPSASTPEEAEFNRKREMVATLTLQTGMNVIWSEKCLIETNWDFNNALYAFTEFHKAGKIPEEAFSR